MTSAQIRHILTGLKSEIRREKDRDRVVHLCEMGLYWSEELRTNHLVKCLECGEKKPLSAFGFAHNTKTDVLYRRERCYTCLGRAEKKNKMKKYFADRLENREKQ